MPQQLDLLGKPELKLRITGSRTEPRLWVRRLVIWSAPGAILRDVRLRPGLNIVWSPDPAEEDQFGASDALGHGSGKTLFCRLVRYCLGEDSFAPEAERDSIALAFPHGLVGGEVMVNGAPWAVVRSLGMVKKNAAVAGGDLDTLAAGTEDGSGFDAFLDDIESKVLSGNLTELLPGERIRSIWPLALAWLTRDQECRFDHVLEWRDQTSDSGSPARGLSGATALEILRAFLGALDPREKAVRESIDRLEQKRKRTEKETGHREWEADQLRARTREALGMDETTLPFGSLAIEGFRQAVQGRLAQARGGPSTSTEALSAEHDKTRDRAEEVSRRLAEVTARIPVLEDSIRRWRGEGPGLGMAARKAEHPICPVCDVPIDRALAEGCKLSHKVPDLEEVKRRRAHVEEQIRLESEQLERDKQDQARLKKEVAVAERQAGVTGDRFRGALRTHAEREEAVLNARRIEQDIERLHRLLMANEEAEGILQRLAEEIAKERDNSAAYRSEQATVFIRLRDIFDPIIRDLVGPRASGGVTLDGNGLHLKVELGGERSTAAIDSLKVLAFDLSAMCMSIEGATHVPAFLVHDSPREADLGLSAYHRLFRFARRLEDFGGQPLFQYIVTTTTRPPEELATKPWLVLKLAGEPAEERLLRKDL